MYREYYRFGGLTLALSGEAEWTPSELCQPFRAESAPGQREIRVAFADQGPVPPKHAAHENGLFRWREGECFCLLQSYGSRYFSFARRTGDITELALSEGYRDKLSARVILESAGLFDLLAVGGMLVLHSSFLRTREGEALIFSGPSGVGKSTQAALWERFAGGEVINGDRTLLRPADGSAHGILYAGTSGICRNASAPVRAILLLEQAEENRIFRPRPQEAFARLLSQCAYYPWDGASAARMTELTAELLSAVPVYCLACRKDESAVRTLEDYLRRE